MRIRYLNAQLWRGTEPIYETVDFDVVDGLICSPKLDIQTDKTVDLRGAFVMPAFRDGHCHPLFAGRESLGPDVSDARSLSEIQSIIKDFAASNPSAHWIDGAAYDRSIQAKFTRSELDSAVSERPVVLHGADHHTLWVNTRALELCGLMDHIPDLPSGSVDVDDLGVPTGIVREWDAMQLILSHVPELTMEQELESLDWAQTQLLRAGVVELQEAWIDRGMAEIYIESAKQGRLRIKTHLAFRADPSSWRRDFEYFVDVRSKIRALGHENLGVNAMKFFIDGVLGSGTASVLEPYISSPSGHAHGEFAWKHDELIEAARAASDLGFQLHMHAIGDSAVRKALDLVEQVRPSINAVIAHTELVSDSDIPRFIQLNVTANFEPLWAREDGQLMSCLPYLGRERLNSMYRMRDLTTSGAKITFGSDWPVSSPVPLLGIATAVNRAEQGKPSWTKAQALNVWEALTAYTVSVSEQLNGSKGLGTLAEGQSAEFVVLSENPLTVDDQDLFKIRVLAVNTPSEPLLAL